MIWDILEPVNEQNLIFASKWFAYFFLFQYLGAKFIPGFFYESKIKKYSLTGLQMFFLTQIIYFAGKIKKAPKYKNTSFLPDFLFEFWCGVEHNPTIFGVDLKMFFYQPSLLGLLLFHFAFAEYQFRAYGFISLQTIIYVIFWWTYLITHYIKEEFMITTWDIIEEHFGFMLVWGDLIYVPFWYSIIGWWIADYIVEWSTIQLVGLVLFHCCFHFLFRTSNWQKHAFKKLGKKAIIWGKSPQLLEDKLLISGWWGIGRHLNYTGEIMTYLSFSLCSGFQSFIPFILPVSLTILLGQRAWRDDIRCKEKYGILWGKYCRIAKFKMVPFAY